MRISGHKLIVSVFIVFFLCVIAFVVGVQIRKASVKALRIRNAHCDIAAEVAKAWRHYSKKGVSKEEFLKMPKYYHYLNACKLLEGCKRIEKPHLVHIEIFINSTDGSVIRLEWLSEDFDMMGIRIYDIEGQCMDFPIFSYPECFNENYRNAYSTTVNRRKGFEFILGDSYAIEQGKFDLPKVIFPRYVLKSPPLISLYDRYGNETEKLKMFFEDKARQFFEDTLGIGYPIYRNNLELLNKMILEGHSVKGRPLIVLAIQSTCPYRSERWETLEEVLEVVQAWDQRACSFIEVLIKNGADVNLAGGNVFDAKPLSYAARYKLENVAKLLIKAGAEPNLKTENDDGPLLNSIVPPFWEWDNWEIVKLLLDHGANPNSTDRNGNTPLHESVWFGADISVVRWLLEAGADPSLKNNEGKTALDIEKSWSKPDEAVVSLLESYMTKTVENGVSH